jgi:poly-gamma-glutamate biosynthesis protein PgsC/CapC
MIALNLLAVAIGLGLFFTLLLSQAFGLAVGGLVVPGYMALQLMSPLNVAITLAAAVLTFLIVRVVSAYVVLYGRRHTILMILTGYIIAGSLDLLVGGLIAWYDIDMVGGSGDDGEAMLDIDESALAALVMELSIIGYIIPGLIAIWFDRQGVLETLCGLTVVAVLVRLTLIVIMPETLMAYESQQTLRLPGW